MHSILSLFHYVSVSRKAVTAFLILRTCFGQSTSTAFCSTCSAMPTCTGCNVNADVITVSNTSWHYGDPATGTPYLEADLQFTAYSVTTTTLVAGNCITHTGLPTPLLGGYIVPIPVVRAFPGDFPASLQTVTGSLSRIQFSSYTDEKYSGFLDDAYSSFYEEIGYKGCVATLPPSQIYPMYIGEVAYTPETALPSATPVDSSPTSLLSTKPTESSGSVRRATSVRIIIVSVVLPTSLLVTILLCFVLIRRYRKKRSQAFSANHPAMTSNVQLYVDQKAELEDEDRRKQVLEAIDIRHEMGGEDMMFEMSSDGNTQIDFSLSNQRQELRGAEHSNELEVPGNI